jgi:hypothetical protein
VNLKAEFAPYAALDKLDKIMEYKLWDCGLGVKDWLGCGCDTGIACCIPLEAFVIYRVELRNFFDLMLKKKEDPHPLTLMISQLPDGKSQLLLIRYSFSLFSHILPCLTVMFSLFFTR